MGILMYCGRHEGERTSKVPNTDVVPGAALWLTRKCWRATCLRDRSLRIAAVVTFPMSEVTIWEWRDGKTASDKSLFWRVERNSV